MIRPLLFVCCLCGSFSSDVPVETPGWSPGCEKSSWSLDKVLDRLTADNNIEVSDGVKFVKVNETFDNAVGRSAKDSIMARIKRFFTDYELRVKLSDYFHKKVDMVDTVRKAVQSLNNLEEGDNEEFQGKGHNGFGGGKKGGSPILMMATMMGGTMAALGFGALAMLVMKALTVSSMAFLLSAVIGLRRLLRRPDDDGGFGRISYIPVHAEHRKRRSLLDLPYRAYAKHR